MPASVVAAVVSSVVAEAITGPLAFTFLDAGLFFGSELAAATLTANAVGAAANKCGEARVVFCKGDTP